MRYEKKGKGKKIGKKMQQSAFKFDLLQNEYSF